MEDCNLSCCTSYKVFNHSVHLWYFKMAKDIHPQEEILSVRGQLQKFVLIMWLCTLLYTVSVLYCANLHKRAQFPGILAVSFLPKLILNKSQEQNIYSCVKCQWQLLFKHSVQRRAGNTNYYIICEKKTQVILEIPCCKWICIRKHVFLAEIRHKLTKIVKIINELETGNMNDES